MAFLLTQADIDYYLVRGIKFSQPRGVFRYTEATIPNSTTGDNDSRLYIHSEGFELNTGDIRLIDPFTQSSSQFSLFSGGDNYTARTSISDSTWGRVLANGDNFNPPAPQYQIDKSTVDSLASKDIFVIKDGLPIEHAIGYQIGDTIELEAGGGAEFYYEDNDPLKASVYIFDQLTQQDHRFTLSNNNKTATLIVTSQTGGTIVADSIVVTPEVSGSNSVYVIDGDKLKEINNNRYITHISNETESSVFDFGQYILSVLEVPVDIDPVLIEGSETVKLLNHDTGVSAEKLSTDLIRIDLGSISVPMPDSLAGLSNTLCLLHLPRISPFSIELEYVIGETLSIEYLVDLYTGIATVNITSTKIDSVIESKQVDLGVNIPYAPNRVDANISNATIEVGGENGVVTPFIELLNSTDSIATNFFNAVIPDSGLLVNETGFITVDNVELEVDALSVEKEMINNKLSSGVIIK